MFSPFPFRLGGFGSIIIDSPWSYDDQAGRMKLSYPSMTDDELRALPVSTLAAHRGHLYSWTDDAHLELALECVKRYGYSFKKTIVWVKTLDETDKLRDQILEAAFDQPLRGNALKKAVARIGKVKIGGGHYLRSAHELCLFATRNLVAAVHDIPTVFFAPHIRGADGKIIHSAKPPHIHEIAERMSPGPRIELFARTARPEWERWGNEAPKHEVTAP